MSNKNLQNKNNSNLNDSSLTKEDFLKTVDFEINQISSEQQRNGWTKWALYGVLAGSLWLLLDHWEKGNFDFNVVLLLIVVFSIGLDILRQSKRLLPHRINKYKRILRFKPVTNITSSAAFFLYTTRHLIVFIIVILFATKVSWIPLVIALWYYGKFSIFSLFAFVVQYFPSLEVIHNSESKLTSKQYYKYWGLTVAALIWALIGYLNAALAYNPEGIRISNYRIAGLLVVIGYTFYLLLELSEKVPLLAHLIEIRRDLSFNRIDLKTAIKQAEIAIAGISVDEKLQEDIASVMPLLEQRNLEFNRIHSKITAISKEIPKEFSEITKEHEKKAKEVLLPCLEEIDNLVKQDDEIEKLKRKLKIHVSIAENESPESVKSAKDFLKSIEELETEIENKAETMLADFLPMIENIKAKKQDNGKGNN